MLSRGEASGRPDGRPGDLFMQILKDVPGLLMKQRNYFDEYCTRDATTLVRMGER